MKLATSVYLDAVRFFAALAVFVYHFTNWQRFGFDFHLPNGVGHKAVLIFFVLSGFVIAYVADTRENNPRRFLVSRFARLYSVAIPALLLTLCLDSVGMLLEPGLYDANAHQNIFARLIASVLFLNQIWNLTITALSNGPYWSIAFEFWYYMIFAAAFFLHGKIRLITISVLCVFVGPRILFYMPLWLLGVLAYRLQQGNLFDGRLSSIVFPVTLILVFVLMFFGTPLDGLVEKIKEATPDGYIHVYGVPIFLGGRSVPANFLFGLVFALTIVSSQGFFSHFKRRPKVIKSIRMFASYTFSIYLFHAPLLLFYQALIKHDPRSPLSLAILAGATLASVAILARYTEHKKDFTHRLIDRIIDSQQKMFSAATKLLATSKRSG